MKNKNMEPLLLFLIKRYGCWWTRPVFLGVMIVAWYFQLAPAALAASHDASPLLPHTVCKGAPLPSGWVIMDTFNDAHHCSGGPLVFGNVWAIAPVIRKSTPICANSPRPAGFVITSQMADLRHCFGIGHLINMVTIAPVLRAAVTICASSPIPSGWVVTGEDRLLDHPQASTICQADAAMSATIPHLNALVQKTIQRAFPLVMQVCADSPLPKGFRIIQSSIYVPSCRGDQGTSLLIAPITSLLKW